MPEAPSDWEDVLLHAEQTGDVDLLTAVCLAVDPVVQEPHSTPRSAALPVGRPPRALTHRAARRVLQEVATPEQRVVARVFRWWQAQPARLSASGQDERPQRLADCALSLTEAAERGDGLLIVWARLRYSRALDPATQWAEAAEQARAAAERAHALLVAGQMGDAGPFSATSVPLLAPDTPEHAARVLAYYGWHWAAASSRAGGDLEGWQAALAALEPLLPDLAAERPSLVAMALAQRCTLARATGDRDLSMALEGRLEVMARAEGPGQAAYTRQYLASAAANAEALRDWPRAHAVHRTRFERAVRQAGGHVPPLQQPGDAMPTLLEAKRAGLRTIYNRAANAAYDCAATLWRSGATRQDPTLHAEALAWLDVAEAVWQGWAHNGLWAVRAARAQLRATTPGEKGPASSVPDLLEVATHAPRRGLRVNAVSAAAELSEPGDPQVLAALQALGTQSGVAREDGVVGAATARWHARWAETAGGDEAWARAEAAAGQALDALAGTSWEGALGRRPADLEAWVLACTVLADAQAALGRAARDSLRAGVLGVAQLLVDVSTHEQRARLASRHAPLVRRALESAVARRDHDDVDQVLEVLRRDSVGLLLTELTRAEGVPDEVRDPVRRLLAGLSAQVSVEALEGGGSRGATRALQRAAEQVEAHQLLANEQVDEVLGALGAVADWRTVAISAADVLGRRDAVLLQLVPSSVPLLDDGGQPRLYRRCTWRDREWLDSVPLPDGLGEDVPPTRRFTDATALLPAPLLQDLLRRGDDDPLRLLIVPTGLFHLHLDALLLSDGQRLLARAAVSVHTSLATAQRLLSSTNNDPRGAVGVFDTALQHTAVEKAALARCFRPWREVSDVAGLLGLAEHAGGVQVLALGVHGSDDPGGGWGQAKRLPSGETLTAAQALQGRYPEMCVLASCHSQVRARGGLDLAGFPLALFARGARTVVGTLDAVEDEATAQIMARFYEHVAEGDDPVHALRRARLGWLEEFPARWGSVERWSRLVLYGGAHC